MKKKMPSIIIVLLILLAVNYSLFLLIGYFQISFKDKTAIKTEMQKKKIIPPSVPEDKKAKQLINDGTFEPGFNYWYGPTLLEENWHAVISGTVSKTEEYTEKRGELELKITRGEILVNKIHYAIPAPEEELVFADKIVIDGGFEGLNPEDKVLVFLKEYEGKYAIPDYQGSTSHLGIKLSSFDDPVISAAIRRAENQTIPKEDIPLWEKIDPKGLKHQLDKEKYLKEAKKEEMLD